MRFIFNLLFREIRSSWKRLLFFFLCIAIGVGSVIALRSLIGNLAKAVAGDARGLLTADIDISSTSPFSPSEIAMIEEVIGGSKIIEARNEVITTSTMARRGDSIQFVELKGIESGFPLVGEFTMQGGKPFEMELIADQGLITEPALLDKLKANIGDSVRIGNADFQIRGVFDKEPGGAGGFRVGPRVFIEKKAFDSSGLTRTTSRARRRILYRASEDPTPLIARLREALKGSIITVTSYKEAQDNLGEQFERTEDYLSLTGLLILVLGGIGVWNVARVFVEQKRKTVAILKCLGAGDSRIFTIYLLQILTLGLIGSFFGAVLAQLSLWLVDWKFHEALPENMSYALQNGAIWQGLILGVLISLLFSVLPLLQIRNIKPSLLLRDSNNLQIRKLDPTKWLFGLICLSGLLGVAVWQAGSIKVGAAFLGGLAITSLILYLSAFLLTKLLRNFRNIGPFSLSQAVNSLYRPGNQTRVILLAVGLGAFVVLTVQSLQSILVKNFDISRNGSIPSLFIFDIQKSQLQKIKEMAEKATSEEAKPIPIVRMRIAEIDGKPIDFAEQEIRRQQGQLGREFAVTYRPGLDTNERIIAGKFWDGSPSSEPEVSISQEMRGVMGLDVGSTVTFDVLGRRITARVTSVRKFEVRNTRTAFIFLFRPGTLEKAPQVFILPILKKFAAEERNSFQKSILDEFPNIQVFDVTDVVKAINNLISNFVLAISFVGSFVILTGILILIGSIALTKSQRIYENAILKTLGAKRGMLLAILLTEYAILGLIAGIIAVFFSNILSYAVTHYIFSMDWEFDPKLSILGALATLLLVMLVGSIASFGVLFKKPLATLRNQ